MTVRTLLRAVALAPLVSCMGGHGGGHSGLPPSPELVQPEAWSGALDAPRAVDADPEDGTVEVTLTARPGDIDYLPGKPAAVWTYNGSIPGPTIEAEVGDRVRVHFRNELPEPTTIHWHGVRVANAMDGTARVMDPVPPGGTFEYEFFVPDAGTYWYHPHVRSDIQAEKGLYGAIVVREPSEPSLAAADELLVIDDVLIDPTTGALDERRDERAEMMGKEGNLLLVNGRRGNGAIATRAGETRRWRLVNAATARYFRLVLDGGSMSRIAGDGALLASPQPAAELLLAPGERADVVVSVADPGATATLRAGGYERADGAGAGGSGTLVRLVASGDPALTPAPPPSVLAVVPALASPIVTRTIRLGERMTGASMAFTINDRTFPEVPVVTAAAGTVERWTIVNETTMDHPFHLHGFRFQRAGVREWKDTVNVRASSRLELLVDVDARPGGAGGWMYHCHILEHEEGGMMAELLVR